MQGCHCLNSNRFFMIETRRAFQALSSLRIPRYVDLIATKFKYLESAKRRDLLPTCLGWLQTSGAEPSVPETTASGILPGIDVYRCACTQPWRAEVGSNPAAQQPHYRANSQGLKGLPSRGSRNLLRRPVSVSSLLDRICRHTLVCGWFLNETDGSCTHCRAGTCALGVETKDGMAGISRQRRSSRLVQPAKYALCSGSLISQLTLASILQFPLSSQP